MIVEMTAKYAEYERHKGERFETDGRTYVVGNDEVYYLKGYGAFAKDGLREVQDGRGEALPEGRGAVQGPELVAAGGVC